MGDLTTLICECGYVFKSNIPGTIAYHKKSSKHRLVLKSKKSMIGLNSFKCCECDSTYNYINFYKHIKKGCNYKKKLTHYNNMKETLNCCSRCLRTGIKNVYFIEDVSVCKCCSEILKGGVKKCRSCEQYIDIDKFERPYLLRCKNCTNERLSKKVTCEQCEKLVSLSNLHHHKKFCRKALEFLL